MKVEDLTRGKRPGTLSLSAQPKAPLRAATGPRYDLSVLVELLRPPSLADISAIRHGLAVSHSVLVLIGSAKRPRSPARPFKAAEVEAMLRPNFTADENSRLRCEHLTDTYNNTRWVSQGQAIALALARSIAPAGQAPRIAMVGHRADRTANYARMFGWPAEVMVAWTGETAAGQDSPSMRLIREDYYLDAAAALERHSRWLPENVQQFMAEFAKGEDYQWVAQEAADHRRFRQPYEGLQHPPMFHTADAVVVQSGRVLLTRRSLRPGLGLLALPGVFVAPHETMEEAMLRAVLEKTRFRVPTVKDPTRLLQRAIRARTEFDYPWRSERGRIASTSFLIELFDDVVLPEVSGDRRKGTSEAMFTPISELNPEEMFEDHGYIIETMVSQSGRHW